MKNQSIDSRCLCDDAATSRALVDCIFSNLGAKSDAAAEESKRTAKGIVLVLNSRPHFTTTLIADQTHRFLVFSLDGTFRSLRVKFFYLGLLFFLLWLRLLRLLLVQLLLLLIVLLHRLSVWLSIILLSVLELCSMSFFSCLLFLLILLCIFLHLNTCPP